MGTPNIWLAVASYIFPWVRNTSSTQSSPASHAITRASMAEKSASTSAWPGLAVKTVRMSWDRVSGTLPNTVCNASRCRCFTSSRARGSRLPSMYVRGRFWGCTIRPAQRPVRFAP